MIVPPPVADIIEEPAPDERVSFTVLCKPASGISLDEFRQWLVIESLDRVEASSVRRLLPEPQTLPHVASQLRAHGFEVFDIPGSVVVFARGRVDRFEEIFGGHLVRMTREVLRSDQRKELRGDQREVLHGGHREALRGGYRRRTMTKVVLQPGTELPPPERIEGALLISIAEPPLLAKPRTHHTTTATAIDYCLSLPTSVARITKASKVHRHRTSGHPATGHGVTVAVIDTGFAHHSFFTKHPYKITREAAPDADSPEIDLLEHGTPVLANFLACAPGATVHAIKFNDIAIAIGFAANLPDVKVISITSFHAPPKFDSSEFGERFQIAQAVALKGITVVVAAGDHCGESFPATLPEVIAVGGVSVDSNSKLTAWNQSPSFRSAFGRVAPDLCGVASHIHMPIPQTEPGKKNPWECTDGGTSTAAPQVAAIATLLIQKQPSLTPAGVRTVLASQGTDVKKGKSFTGDCADDGPDLATGGGLVNALKAWLSV
jgi:hypothetical protein